MSSLCPFKVGNKVIYSPSAKGKAYDATTPLPERLAPGKEYEVDKIQDASYVVVKGYHSPGGGIYWSEFKLKP